MYISVIDIQQRHIRLPARTEAKIKMIGLFYICAIAAIPTLSQCCGVLPPLGCGLPLGINPCGLPACLPPSFPPCGLPSGGFPPCGFPPCGLPPCGLPPCGLPACLPGCVSSCGPAPTPLPVIQGCPVTHPTIEGPIIPLPSPCIPAPKTIAHKCVCTKTVVKPQVIQRTISVPSVARYLKQFYTPVVENIAYTARPNCPEGPAPCAPCAPCAPFLPPCAPVLPPCGRCC